MYLYGCQFPGTSPDHPGISPAGRERYQKRSGISPRPLCPRPPDGDIPGRRGHPGPRWGYPRPLGDIPGRVSGISSTSGDIPGLWRGASPTGSGMFPALRGMPRPRLGRWCRTRKPTCVCHITRSKPTQQHVKRCLCDTTRPSEGSCCAAVAAAHAQPSCPGARRGPASHTARRGEASGGQSRPETTVCAAVWRALFDRADEPPRPGQREERGLREAAEPASLRHGKERGRGVRKQGAEARRCGVLEPRAEAPARESTRRLS